MYFKKSPCIGVCEITPHSPYCSGCMRDSDDLSVWKTLDFAEKKARWLRLGTRRSAFSGPSIIRDQLLRLIPITGPITRIVSLVPSLTQTLYDLGLADQVVGTTVFCPQPPQVALTKVGGTKKLNLARIRTLKPDLIIANKEENTQRDIAYLSAEFPVWISDVTTVDDALHLIWLLGEYLDRQQPALNLIDSIMTALPKEIQSPHIPTHLPRFACLVWRAPWMVVAGNTFIHSWLQRFGLQNCCHDLSRYPEISLEDLRQRDPELIILPDEPYPFSEKDRQELQGYFPHSRILLVAGKYCSWYGSLMRDAIPYLKEIL